MLSSSAMNEAESSDSPNLFVDAKKFSGEPHGLISRQDVLVSRNAVGRRCASQPGETVNALT